MFFRLKMGNTRLDGRDSLDGVALARQAFYCAILMSTRLLTHHINKIRSIQGETPSYKLLSRTFDYRHIMIHLPISP